jgi:hypothetical protein
VTWWSSGRTRTPMKSSRLVFCPLARPQVLLMDVGIGKHQLIMTASMKVIRAVAPSGVLYTAVASSSTEYGLLFAEYLSRCIAAQRGVGQASAHHDGLHEGHQSGRPIWRPHHEVGGRWPRGRGLINPACSFLKRQQTEGDPCSGWEKILLASCM